MPIVGERRAALILLLILVSLLVSIPEINVAKAEPKTIFVPYDYKEYENCRGFTLDYHKFTPGPKIYSQKDFLTYLINYLNNPRMDSEERKKMRSLLHRYRDFKNCQRLLNKIYSINKL